MNIVSLESFTRCFDKVEDAGLAVTKGNSVKAVSILTSLKYDARILQKASMNFHDKLEVISENIRSEIDELTLMINEQYDQECKLEREKQNLLAERKSVEERLKNEEDAYKSARDQIHSERLGRRKAEADYNHLHRYWWIPVYGLILAINERIVDNAETIRESERNEEIYEERAIASKNEMECLTTKMHEKDKEIYAKTRSIDELKQKRSNLHIQLGNSKEMSVFILEAVHFWELISCLTHNASETSGRFEKIMRKASLLKSKCMKVMKGNGTQTLVRSFKDSWMEIMEMFETHSIVAPIDSKNVLQLKQ